ncbi:PIM1 kinase, partial [Picathartes gymnocephalus]|nr:PIM1 kinase [Picathartes gymnocephalus]
SPAGKGQEALQERHWLGSLLGRGGFGSVTGGRAWRAPAAPLGSQVAIKCVSRDRIHHWGELANGTRTPLEIELLDKVSTGFRGVVQLLDLLELPSNFLLVMERP